MAFQCGPTLRALEFWRKGENGVEIIQHKKQQQTYLIFLLFALAAFEVFNFSVTEYALTDLWGDLRILGLNWASFLAGAFCGIDFIAVSAYFGGKPKGWWWMLFAAWLVAASLNALIVWWGISLAMYYKVSLGIMVERVALINFVPGAITVVVLFIRVLILLGLAFSNKE